MIKFLLKLSCIAWILAMPLQMSANTGDGLKCITVDGNNLYFSLDDINHTATLLQQKRLTYKFTTFTVPTKVTDGDVEYRVILGSGALNNSPNLTTLVIPEGFTEIPENFASSSPNLSSVTIPSSVTAIGCGAFSDCTSLTAISLPEKLRTLGKACEAFDGKMNGGAFSSTGLVEIEIPAGVEELGDCTFSGCRELTKVTVPDGLKVIGRNCFADANKLGFIALPASLEIIHRLAFFMCSSLESIVIPENVNFIGSCALDGTGISELVLPSHLAVIRARIFNRTSIESFTVPAGVERVNPMGFWTTALKELKIADSEKTLEFDLTASFRYGRDPWVDNAQETDAVGNWIRDTVTKLYIGRNIATWVHPEYDLPTGSRSIDYIGMTNPFYSLVNLEDITVGECVTDASQLEFGNYPALKSITFLSSVPPVMGALTPEQVKSVKVIVPEGAIDAYKSVKGWEEISNITSGIDSIEAGDATGDAEYFNLNGVKVSNPSDGVYIKRQGAKVTKVIL